ncbi:MAG: N-acetylmuramoyl-L-alanine amidase [Spirochaetia bacterium]|nr:N-acetylmuramoyl-L-alanine amidase [Spirochaetia bacterium]
MKINIKILFGIIPLILAGIIFYSTASSYKYTVVLDPGHGGLSLNPVSLHGDKYDPVGKKYLSPYQQGADYKNLYESEIAYEIAVGVKNLLDLSRSREGRLQLHKILLKYDKNAEAPKEAINVIMSRDDGYPMKDFERLDGKTDRDYNAPYRLFDFPDFTTSKRSLGLISRINAHEPDLVVSLHLDSVGPTNGAMAPVVTPGYETYKQAIDYINGTDSEKRKIKSEFKKSPYLNWIQMDSSRSAFEWFLCDAWIYFTGYWSYKDGLNPDPFLFRGIRQDYISWKYQGKSWDFRADETKPTPIHLKSFIPSGEFWKRELSEPEKWRRENGTEGVGGDNLYSANELLRFIRLGLLANQAMPEQKLPDIREPHWSTWSLPTYINAISAYIELGFLNNKYDRERIEKFKEIHAEAIAVGIYSLFYGLHISDLKAKDLPTGKALDLNKYKTYNDSDYFKSVMH